VAGLPRPKALIITMRHDHTLNTLYTAHGASFVSELAGVAGGDNIYADAATTYPEASKETVVLKAPEVILEFHAGEKIDDAERRRFAEDWRQLPSLPAVQNGRVYVITEPHAVRPGPRIGEIARLLAGLLHPEAPTP
jgi:ABC-type Fe3+-hydroxamate transport system substrate-binding protein